MRASVWLTLVTLSSLACSESSPSQNVSTGGGGSLGAAGTSANGGTALSAASAGQAAGAGVGGASGASSGAGAGGAAGAGGSAGVGGTAGVTSSGGSAGSAAGAGGASGLGGAAGASAGASNSGGEGGASDGGAISVLVFSKTASYRHESIPVARTTLMNLAGPSNWTVTASEDASTFTDAGLAGIDVIVFLSTTGDILNEAQQGAFERFIRSGKGFVGIHAASDTEFDWPFFGELVGAYFSEHPDIQEATLEVEDATHPTMTGIPTTWTRTDEWYSFRENPRPSVNVLMTLDEASYSPGTSAMGPDHPIAWWLEYEGSRSFYTALGHTSESYADPVFVAHLARAIDWAARREP